MSGKGEPCDLSKSEYFEAVAEMRQQSLRRAWDKIRKIRLEVIQLKAENEELKHKVSAGVTREWDLQNQIRESRASRANVVESNKALRKASEFLLDDLRKTAEVIGEQYCEGGLLHERVALLAKDATRYRFGVENGHWTDAQVNAVMGIGDKS